MKIQELRDTVKKHKKEDLEFLVSELYKAIPKSKIEENQIDDLIQKPKKEVKSKEKKIKCRSIAEIKEDISYFVSNAKEQNYLCPNRIIPKAQRSKWRFLVKNLFKEVQLAEKNGNSTSACALALRNLYEVLTYSCDYQLFTAYDTFESVGITQTDFFNQILKYYRASLEVNDFINVSIRIIIDNSLNRYTIYSELMNIFLSYCETPDMKEMVISSAKKILEDVKAEPDKKNSFYSIPSRTNEMSYNKKQKINNVVEVIFRAHCLLFEYEKAIKFFRDNSIESSKEILLYVIVRMLFGYQNHEIILKEINRNMDCKPRENLLKVRDFIVKNNKIPEYL